MLNILTPSFETRPNTLAQKIMILLMQSKRVEIQTACVSSHSRSTPTTCVDTQVKVLKPTHNIAPTSFFKLDEMDVKHRIFWSGESAAIVLEDLSVMLVEKDVQCCSVLHATPFRFLDPHNILFFPNWQKHGAPNRDVADFVVTELQNLVQDNPENCQATNHCLPGTQKPISGRDELFFLNRFAKLWRTWQQQHPEFQHACCDMFVCSSWGPQNLLVPFDVFSEVNEHMIKDPETFHRVKATCQTLNTTLNTQAKNLGLDFVKHMAIDTSNISSTNTPMRLSLSCLELIEHNAPKPTGHRRAHISHMLQKALNDTLMAA